MGFEQIVHEDKKRYDHVDARLGLNPCGGTANCGNEEKTEDLLGAMTANYFVSKIDTDDDLGFNQLVYGPNTSVEARCGFDHSIGLVNSDGMRIHVQYKLIREWCDTKCDEVYLAKPKNEGVDKTQITLFDQIKNLSEWYSNQGQNQTHPWLIVFGWRTLGKGKKLQRHSV